MKSTIGKLTICTALFMALISVSHIGTAHGAESSIKLTDAQAENLVKRSYKYVAMYNVNNKFAITQGGWNTGAWSISGFRRSSITINAQ